MCEDSDDLIKMCLNCKKPECTNCIENGTNSGYREATADAAKRMFREGYTPAEIAERLGVSRHYIMVIFSKIGISTRRGDPTDGEFKKLHREGYTDKRLAEHFGISLKSVWRRRKRMNLPCNYDIRGGNRRKGKT